jgi:hypothetical protein
MPQSARRRALPGIRPRFSLRRQAATSRRVERVRSSLLTPNAPEGVCLKHSEMSRPECRLTLNQAAPRSGGGLNELLGRSERTDHDVIPIRITECEFSGASIGAQMRFLFQSTDKGACSKQRLIEVVHTKEQE